MAQVLPLVFLFALFLVPQTLSDSTGIRVDMVHVDSIGNFTKSERLLHAVQRTKDRMAALSAKLTADVRAPVHVSDTVYPTNIEYLVSLAIGTPSVPFSAIVDTGSDLIWTQCQPCERCFSQPTPIFDSSRSSTFSTLPCASNLCQALPNSACSSSICDYQYSYGDRSSTQGVLASESFTIGSASITNIGFGCGRLNQGDFANAAGILGLGRGPLSLNSQLNSGKFSYCLTPNTESNTSPLLLGSLAVLQGSPNGAVQTTPFVQNQNHPTYYYLSLQGITLGTQPLQIPQSTFTLNPDGTGGFFIDSGSTLTALDTSAYVVLMEAFESQVNLPLANGNSLGLDLCFELSSESSVQWPNLIFHFANADMILPAANYVASDSTTGLACIAIVGSNGLSILGNFQQQNIHILYDLESGTLSFVPTQCDQL